MQQACKLLVVVLYSRLYACQYDGTFSLFEGKRDEANRMRNPTLRVLVLSSSHVRPKNCKTALLTQAEIMRWIERTVKLKSYGWAKDHEVDGCKDAQHTR
eukprot:1176595-Amphidinium_carterae.1